MPRSFLVKKHFSTSKKPNYGELDTQTGNYAYIALCSVYKLLQLLSEEIKHMNVMLDANILKIMHVLFWYEILLNSMAADGLFEVALFE